MKNNYNNHQLSNKYRLQLSNFIENEELKIHGIEEESFKDQLSSEQVVPETIEYEDQFEAETEVRSERSLSSEKVTKQSPQHSDNEDEHERFQKEPSSEEIKGEPPYY